MSIGDATDQIQLTVVGNATRRTTHPAARYGRTIKPPVTRRVVDEHLVVRLLRREVVVLKNANGVDEAIKGYRLKVMHREARGCTNRPRVCRRVVDVDVRSVFASAEQVKFAAYLHVASLVTPLCTRACLTQGVAPTRSVDRGPLTRARTGSLADADVIESGVHRHPGRCTRDDDAYGRRRATSHTLTQVALQHHWRA